MVEACFVWDHASLPIRFSLHEDAAIAFLIQNDFAETCPGGESLRLTPAGLEFSPNSIAASAREPSRHEFLA
jgi:hypothetical protein